MSEPDPKTEFYDLKVLSSSGGTWTIYSKLRTTGHNNRADLLKKFQKALVRKDKAVTLETDQGAILHVHPSDLLVLVPSDD